LNLNQNAARNHRKRKIENGKTLTIFSFSKAKFGSILDNFLKIVLSSLMPSLFSGFVRE